MLLSGAKVVLWDIDAKALAAAKETLSALGTVDGAAVELTDDAAVNAATGAVPRAWPHRHPRQQRRHHRRQRDHLGTAARGVAACRRVNLIAPISCRAVVPQMLQRGYGHIVNVASVAGRKATRTPRTARLEGRADRAHQVARQGVGDAGHCW